MTLSRDSIFLFSHIRLLIYTSVMFSSGIGVVCLQTPKTQTPKSTIDFSEKRIELTKQEIQYDGNLNLNSEKRLI